MYFLEGRREEKLKEKDKNTWKNMYKYISRHQGAEEDKICLLEARSCISQLVYYFCQYFLLDYCCTCLGCLLAALNVVSCDVVHVS